MLYFHVLTDISFPGMQQYLFPCENILMTQILFFIYEVKNQDLFLIHGKTLRLLLVMVIWNLDSVNGRCKLVLLWEQEQETFGQQF